MSVYQTVHDVFSPYRRDRDEILLRMAPDKNRCHNLGVRRRRLRKGQQLLLPTHRRGGRRDGAGRPKKPGSGVSHLERPSLTHHEPLHVTLRVAPGLDSLRHRRLRKVVFAALAGGAERFGFRLVHFSVQSNHLHLMCEANDRRALTRGMQGLSIRLAKAINRKLGRKGKLFADRYHARAMRTPREVRHALAYVLQNARRHGLVAPPRWLDPCSSALLFKGWCRDDYVSEDGARRLLYDDEDRPILAAPKSWLLKSGWRRCGLLRPDEVPGAAKA